MIPDRRASDQLVRVALGSLILDDLFDDGGSDRFEASDRTDTVRRGDSLAIQRAAADRPHVVCDRTVVGQSVEYCLDRGRRGPLEGELDHRPATLPNPQL